MNKGSRWFLIMAVFAFLSFISFVHIDSFLADQHHLNWLFWTLGVAFAFLTVFALIKVTQNSN